MGVFNSFRKNDGPKLPIDTPNHYPSEDTVSDKDEEHGHNGTTQSGSTGEGDVGTSEHPPTEDYQTLGRWRACVLLITIEVGIGVLSLPSALQTLGLIPGIIALFGFGGLTTYCGYIMVQFYRKYPMVKNLVDCGLYIGGKPFERFLGVAFVFNLVLICASANITMAVALNTLSNHALCTVAFMAFPHIGELCCGTLFVKTLADL